MTARARLQLAGWANSVCIGDYNNDGFDDIFCTYYGQNRLYRNNGDGTFTDVTKVLYMNNRDGTFREEGLDRGVALSDDGAEQSGMGVANACPSMKNAG